MYEFLVIVAAILVAQLLFGAVTLAVMFNKRALKWFAKKSFEIAMIMYDEEAERLVKKDEL